MCFLKLICCVVMVIMIVNGDQHCCRGTVYSKSSGFHCCGTATYQINSTYNAICCNNKLIALSNLSSNIGCCGINDTYNYHTERCCSGNKLKKPFTELNIEFQCCGKQLYNPLELTCCGQSLVKPVNITGDMACCGQIMFNATEYKCCESRIVWSSGHSAEVADHTLFSRKNLTSGFECCGSKLIDYTKFKCCGNEILNVSGPTNLQCCYGGFQKSEETDEVCEGQHVYESVSSVECCSGSGTVKFDSETHECCGELLTSKKSSKGAVCCSVTDCYKL